ncbi:MAG TPA: transcriptional repressor, partial [Candidatus Hydrogenedentes bacterium]|nr:transcriptional repressor [Candidatus Hydrogenedentota bacterium]
RRMPAMTLDTVYRTLGTFEAMGLIERVAAVGNSARFEANLAPHHHFVCKRCGSILDVPPGRFEPSEFTGDLPDGSLLHSARIDMRGICSQCARSSASHRKPARLIE